jgi:hypothetical protein
MESLLDQPVAARQGGWVFYFVTFNVTVFEVARPIFGATVTVTLHIPVLTPLSVVPDTLQNFA